MGIGHLNHPSRRFHESSRSYGQDKIVNWLASETRPEQNNYQPLNDFNLGKVEGFQWTEARLSKAVRDGDQLSVLSIDDTVSVSGSSHESLTSDSSSQTSSTSATDPLDFVDESDRDLQSQSKASLSLPSISQIEIETPNFFRQSTGFSCPSGTSGQVRSLGTRSVRSDSHPIASVVPPREPITTQALSQNFPNKDAALADRSRHFNARRSSCSSKTQSQPCRLKRDTECTDQFVSLLIIFATRLITAIWPLSACPPMMTACFNGAGVLPLQVFIQETLKRSRTSYSTLQVALYYLVLLRARLPVKDSTYEQDGSSPERKQCRAMQCGRRMFLSALMLASKYLQDRNYSARAWSKISGLRSNEINENEREYLSLIDYSLHVPKNTFDNWNKIVIALSKLTKEEPQCRMDLSDSDSDLDNFDNGACMSLSEVSTGDLFSDDWWTDVISKLKPDVVKDTPLTEDFLVSHVPFYKMSVLNPAKPSSRCSISSPGTDLLPAFMDVNFSDSLKSRVDQSKPSTPQTPVQMSPARHSIIPMQPRLRNLPTPQTTPKIRDGYQDQNSSQARLLRCSASMDALGGMRRQCLMNANLDRCPPPRPQDQDSSSSLRSLIRPAETLQGSPSRMATSSIASPASTTSDSTSYTSRSRSSSISSMSSCSSNTSTLPRLRIGDFSQFSSPLAQVSAPSNRASICRSKLQTLRSTGTRFVDEGYGSGEEPPAKFSRQSASSSEADAIEVLMSLSVQSENPSQCVTPTPRNYDSRDEQAMLAAQRGHKRSLSKTESNLHSHVKNLLWGEATAVNVFEDPLRPSTATPKQWQRPSKTWAEPKRALPNASDTKRVAYCALQQYASAPDLASQYLQDVRISAAS